MLRVIDDMVLYAVRSNGDIESYDIEKGSIVRAYGKPNKLSVGVEIIAGKYEGLKGGFLHQDCTDISLVII